MAINSIVVVPSNYFHRQTIKLQIHVNTEIRIQPWELPTLVITERRVLTGITRLQPPLLQDIQASQGIPQCWTSTGRKGLCIINMNLKGIQIPQNDITSGRLRSLHLDSADDCIDVAYRWGCQSKHWNKYKCYNYKISDSVKMFPEETDVCQPSTKM